MIPLAPVRGDHAVHAAVQAYWLSGGLFTAQRMATAPDLRRASVLLGMAYPAIPPGEWFGIARHNLRIRPDRGGLIILQDRRRTVHALFRYVVEPSPVGGHGRMLAVDGIVMAQLPGDGAMASIAACARRLAGTLHCTSVSLEVPVASGTDSTSGTEPALELLRAGGFRQAAAVMVGSALKDGPIRQMAMPVTPLPIAR